MHQCNNNTNNAMTIQVLYMHIYTTQHDHTSTVFIHTVYKQ